MVHFFAFKVPVYDTRVRIFIGDGSDDSHKKVKSWINKNLDYKLEEYTNLDDLVPEHCFGTAFELKIKDKEARETKHCIYLADFDGSIGDFSILNHEMYHLTNQALRFAGITANEESEEAFTYFYDYITEVIYGLLEKKKLCNKFKQ